MTWNIEGIKPHHYVLSEVLLSQLPDLVFLSEPQTYQTDIEYPMGSVKHEYCYWLNGDDTLDPDLPLVKSKASGGTLAMWRRWLDPFITVHHVQSSAILPLVLQLPGARTSVHIAIYLPTSGKEYEFLSELANLKNCLDMLRGLYDNPVIFVRGDGNANPKNPSRFALLNRFITDYALKQTTIEHPTYHHFVGQGKFDSNIDIILYSKESHVQETITKIICKFEHPEISSHHDIILSEFTLPRQDPPPKSNGLVVAPRTTQPRNKILWNEDGIAAYSNLVSDQLQQLRHSWQDPSSKALTSVLLQSTNHILNCAASATNPSIALNDKKKLGEEACS